MSSHDSTESSSGWLTMQLGIASAVGYTSSNVCLRAVSDLDPIWVSQIKAVPTLLAVTPWIAWQTWNRRPTFSSWRPMIALCLAAVVVQLGGNVAFLWALDKIGLALTVPLALGTMIVSGAYFGKRLLGDAVSRTIALASAVLMVAIVTLCFGAQEANISIDGLLAAAPGQPLRVAGAVAAALGAGLAFSLLGVTIRYATNQGTPITTVLFVVSLIGFCLLGSVVLARSGLSPWSTTQPIDFGCVVGAGLFDLFAFAAMAKALHLASVMFVNAMNASQTALAAMAGVILFGESVSTSLLVGVSLTIVGLLMMRERG